MMKELDEAYKVLDTIKDSSDPLLIQKMAQKAFSISKLCSEAAIILSRFVEPFEEKESILLENLLALVNHYGEDDIRIYENVDHIRLEIANLYYDYGMLKKALSYYQKIERDNYQLVSKYRMMIIYAYFEDISIIDYYNNHLDSNDDVDFVRMSFPYMLYEYKLAKLNNVKKLFEKISEKNPYILKIIVGEDLSDIDNIEIKEAYKVLKNNSMLINTCPYFIKYLESLC